MPPRKDPTLEVVRVKLSLKDRETLDRLAAETAKRTGKPPTRTAAVRWALQELECRLELERLQAGGVTVLLCRPGPAAPPP